MTEAEISAILSKANGCVESECAVSDVDDLIAELKEQQGVLSARLENIMNAVAHLQAANAAGEKRKTDDVRSIVKDMLRVFTTVVSGVIFVFTRAGEPPPDPLEWTLAVFGWCPSAPRRSSTPHPFSVTC
jgi:hypothetical protein